MAVPSITSVTLNALLNDQARVDRVASNLANITTPGYKREVWVEQYAAGSFGSLIEAGEGATAPGSGSNSAADSLLPQVPAAHVARDLRPGTLKTTGQPLDVALVGPGFFELSSGTGPVYTRQGQFHLDAGGRIVSANGHAVMGIGGEIIATSDKVFIDAQGKVSQGGQVIGQLRVVDWAADQLTAVGGGAFAASGTALEVESAALSLRQGFLENANVDTAHEMVALSAALRHFEASLRIAQGRDELLGTAIRKLGDL